VEKHFRARPRGAWIAERVWEPQIPSCLAPAGVQYTDNHFLSAGFDLDELYGHRLTEDLGHTVKVLPGLKMLRYLIPFHDVSQTIDFLRQAAVQHPGGLAAMGDDLEKFGVWPGTYDLCYRDGWLEHLFSAIASVHIGLERVLNFLAPSAPDRYFESEGKRFPLRWSAAIPGEELHVVDEWQRVELALEAPAARCFWIAPIETVSESEDGFERIYQGPQIMAVWPIELPQGTEWKGQLTLRARALSRDGQLGTS